MELLYLYIEDDGKNIKDCEFNFSSEYHFSYNRKEKFITATKNSDFIPNFWGASNVSNITAIIGKNGTGKSNLLEFIIRYYCSPFGLKSKSKKKLLHIYRFNDELYINRKDIECNFHLRDCHYTQYPLNDHNNQHHTSLLYYSSHIDRNILFDLSHVKAKDISNGGLLRQYAEDRIIVHDSKIQSFADIERLFIEDTFRQIELFIYSKTSYFKDLNLPESLRIIFKEGANKLNTESSLYNKLYIDKGLSELSFLEHIQNRFLYHLFYNQSYINTLQTDDEMSFEDFIKKTYANKLYFSLLELDAKNSIIFENYDKQLGLRSDYVFNFSIKRENLSFNFKSGLYEYYFKGEVHQIPYTLEHFRVLHSSITFEWIGASSGELEYFNLLSRIYCHLDKNVIIVPAKQMRITKDPKYKRNVILLLDEPENAFHPEWQRLFLENLISFLKNGLADFSFQVLIASHSPIIVSDFPKNNIVFLNKNEDGTCQVVDSISRDNTFGANIQTLYRNSFFLDGLPIGEFAKKKINKLFDELEHGDTRSTTWQEIQLVGEPLLRDQLIKEYKQIKDLPPIVDQRIAQLEEEVRILKNRLNDKNRTQ
ncbi:MAG: AAA family ATPase [Dysgonomonas sp.]|uniref:AAA family ATPase n=1 Tax=Dysgonomonas sp. TaxID=1891233 RepID=UPI0039E59A8F